MNAANLKMLEQVDIADIAMDTSETLEEGSFLAVSPPSQIFPLKGAFVLTKKAVDFKHHVRVEVRNIVQYRLQERFSGRLLVAIGEGMLNVKTFK